MDRVSAFYRDVAHEFAKRTVRELGEAIQAIVLYGSVARGEATAESDVDVLVVTCNKAAVRWRIAKIEVDVAARHDYEPWVTSVSFSPDEIRYLGLTGSPFVQDVMKEGIVLYDDGSFLGLRDEVLAVGGRDASGRQADPGAWPTQIGS